VPVRELRHAVAVWPQKDERPRKPHYGNTFITPAHRPQTISEVLRMLGPALDMATCAQILRECGSLPMCPVSLVDFYGIPEDLSAEELETFLREEGAGLRFPRCSKPEPRQKRTLNADNGKYQGPTRAIPIVRGWEERRWITPTRCCVRWF
jgi:hypothetical protein